MKQNNMTLKSWILFTGLLSSMGLSFKADGCGYVRPEIVNFEMLDPLVFPDSTFRPFYYSPSNSYYDQADDVFSKVGVQNNLDQWQDYANQHHNAHFRRDSAKVAIYNYSVKALQKNRQNRFCLFLQDHPAVMNYMVFAKHCEEVLNAQDPWKEKEHNVHAMKGLISEAKEAYQSLDDPFLKFRYAYQLVLLTRYSEQHKHCIKIFNDYLKPLNRKGPLYYWALHHKAYCHLKQGEPIKANLASAEVFAHSPAKRLRAFLYFENEKVEATMQKHDLSNEKEARLLAIKNLMNEGPAIPDMKQIYQYHPQSNLLRFLTVRELNKWETNLYTKRYKKRQMEYQYTLKRQIANDKKHLEELINFLGAVIREKKVKNPDFWKFLRGHALMMNNQYEQAKSQLHKVDRKNLKTERQEVQLQKTKMIANIYTSPVDKDFDEFVYHQLNWLKSKRNVLDQFQRRLGHLALFIGKYYEQNNRLPMAVLFYNYAIVNCDIRDLEYQFMVNTGHGKNRNVRYPYYFYYLDHHATAWQVQDFIDLLRKEDPNDLLTVLLEEIQYDINRVKDLKATIHFRQDELKACHQTLTTIPESFWLRDDMPYQRYLYQYPFVHYLNSYSFMDRGNNEWRDSPQVYQAGNG